MKGTQDDQGVKRRLGEKPRASHISPETLDVSDSDQTDLNLDSAAITTKPTTCDPTRKIDSNISPKISTKILTLFPNIKRSTATCDLTI